MMTQPAGLDRERYKTVAEALQILAERNTPIPRATIYSWLRDKRLTTYRNELQDVVYIDLQELLAKITPQASP